MEGNLDTTLPKKPNCFFINRGFINIPIEPKKCPY